MELLGFNFEIVEDLEKCILSKGKFLSLNCCFINCYQAINLQLFFNKQLNSN